MVQRRVRYTILVLFCAQQSLYTLLRRYSRGVLKEEVSTAAVLLASEGLKFVISACLIESEDEADQSRSRAIASALRTSCPMAVPAVTYLVMNMLSFKAVELVDATVFVMIAQLKVLTTAVAVFFVLQRRLSMPQWRAIILLSLAVGTITYQRGVGSGPGNRPARSAAGFFALGVGMTLLEVSLSGWISAYFEKYLKDGQLSIWGRNLQLAFCSTIVYAIIEVVSAFTLEGHQGFTRRWSLTTLMLVALSGGGGLLVAGAIKYADAVVKSMAASFALIVVVAAEMLFLGAPVDPVVCLSSGVALLALQFYAEAPTVEQPAREPRAAPKEFAQPGPIGAPCAAGSNEEDPEE